MSSEASSVQNVNEAEVLHQAVEVESSEEPPMEEWSSLIIETKPENQKKMLHSKGLYSPGSGEICAKYLAMSQSSVLRHPYYNYPAVLDPGIMDALLKPEQLVIYPDDGQDLYLAVCQEMTQCPVRLFHTGLLTTSIDLSYYGVNPAGVRAMALALRYNKTVKTFNLTDNFLSNDACYHLGEMLKTNTVLTELNLSGCRIGPAGAKRLFDNLIFNKNLVTLNLNKNQLNDEGMGYISDAVSEGLDVKYLYLSYNNLSGKALGKLAEAFDIHNKFKLLDLSWNKLFGVGTNVFLNAMSESYVIEHINLAWNSLCGSRISLGVKNLLTAPLLKSLDLSNNKFATEDIQNIIANLGKAKKLVTLNLSFNPLTPEDALNVISKVQKNFVKVQNVYMENVDVNLEFVSILKRMKGIKSKKNTVVTHGSVIDRSGALGVDARELLLNRAEYLGKKSKKQRVDIALVILQLDKNGVENMIVKDFVDYMAAEAPALDSRLMEEFANVFPGPKSAKMKFVDVSRIADYVRRKWPDRKLPVTPPPEPELPPPPPPPPEPKSKGKGKGKK